MRFRSIPFGQSLLRTRKRRDADPSKIWAHQRTAAQLALAGEGIHSVSLDDAIEAMRLTARDMHSAYKVRYLSRLLLYMGTLRQTRSLIHVGLRLRNAQETSLSGLATTVKIPLSSPAC